MLSFDNKIHTLSFPHKRKNHHNKPPLSEEGIFRSLRFAGSLSVEASLVLPLFLFFLLTLLSTLQLLSFSIRLQQILFEEGMEISEKVFDEGLRDPDHVANDMLRRLDISGRIPVEGGTDGLRFDRSALRDPEFADLSVTYQAKLLFDPFRLFHREFCQHVLFHTWIGYENGLGGRGTKSGEIYVYITEDSEVYHRSRECTHIRLRIREVTGSDVTALRNAYGERYKPCRHCHAKKGDANLYVTTDGDCYHNSLSCSGLSRSVRMIPLSEAGDRRPCSRCGH